MSASMVATATTAMTTLIGATSCKRSTMTFRPAPASADGNWLGGAQIGWNWQRNCTVFGFEADWSWSGMKASETFFDGDAGTQDSLNVSSKLRWFGTVRTRAGIVVDNFLLYVTGGFAYAKFNRSFTLSEDAPATTVTFSSNHTRWGWTAGFGTEWAWSGNWSIKSEVLYMRFVNHDATITGTTVDGINFGVPGRGYNIGSQDEVWITRIGLNYRFGGGRILIEAWRFEFGRPRRIAGAFRCLGRPSRKMGALGSCLAGTLPSPPEGCG